MFDPINVMKLIQKDPVLAPIVRKIVIKIEEGVRVLYVIFQDGVTMRTANFSGWKPVDNGVDLKFERITLLRRFFIGTGIKLQEGLPWK